MEKIEAHSLTVEEKLEVQEWKYVDTKSNPAKDATRGLSSAKLTYSRALMVFCTPVSLRECNILAGSPLQVSCSSKTGNLHKCRFKAVYTWSFVLQILLLDTSDTSYKSSRLDPEIKIQTSTQVYSCRTAYCK